MDIVQAIQKALSGQALLFVGAGFSLGALNVGGAKFKTGRQLAKFLCKACKIEEMADLDEAADIYIEKHDRTHLINLLKKEYTIKEVQLWHQNIADVPWQRIYTTNYDNILETCYALKNKKLTAVTLSDKIRMTDTSSNLCIHLNGYIDRLNAETILNEFKLTNTSYLTSTFLESPWVSLFRSDMKLAESIFFVGYSLYDLDIKRILFESEQLKEKCFFITQEKPGEPLTHRISKFGSIVPIGVEKFAEKISEVKSNYIPVENEEIAYVSFEKIEPAPATSDTTIDDAVFKMFLYGEVDRHYLWGSLEKANGQPYFIYRQAMETFEQSIKQGRKNILIHSELGNGKSMFIEGVTQKALISKIKPFVLRTVRENWIRELDFILRKEERVLIVIENYHNYFAMIDHIQMKRNEQLILVLTARSTVNDVFIDRLDKCLSGEEFLEIDLNKLDDSARAELINLMDHYGLWKEKSGEAYERHLDFISYNCKNEFQGVLISIIKSPDIQKRFADIVTALSQKQDYYEVIMVVLILDVIGVTPSIDTVMELLNSTVVNTTVFRKNTIVRQIIDVNRDKTLVRSSVLARYLLTTLQDSDILLETLVKMVTNSENYIRGHNIYYNIFRELVVYSTLTSIFPEKGRRPNIIRYYEQIKNLYRAKKNPQFWLQYAIARLFFKDYIKAGTYFMTAYAFAKKIQNYNTFQIDNHYSRYLLEKSIEENDPSRCMQDFRDAHAILSRQVAAEGSRHYPFRVATHYADFYNRFFDKLSEMDKKFILSPDYS